MNNTNFENIEYRNAKIRTYSYEDGRQFGVDVFYKDHEYHQDGFQTRYHAAEHGVGYIDDLLV